MNFLIITDHDELFLYVLQDGHTLSKFRLRLRGDSPGQGTSEP